MIDKTFNEKLNYLNSKIKESLAKAGVKQHIEGNLFYEPRFPLNENLDPNSNQKRLRLRDAVQGKKTMFEIGINGGHSSFLALISNEELVVHANDLAQHYSDFYPNIYVPAACEALQELFPGRFKYIFGDCVEAVPAYIKNNPELQFDIVHIDGNKDVYTTDFYNLKPALTKDATVIFDDLNLSRVKAQIDKLIQDKEVAPIDKFPRHTNERYANDILRVCL